MNKEARQETLLWLTVRASGILVLFLALGHLYIMHVANSIDTIDANFVRDRLQSPLWMSYDFLLLTLALGHGSLGVKTIIEDLIRDEKKLKLLKKGLFLFSITLFLLGLAVFIKKI